MNIVDFTVARAAKAAELQAAREMTEAAVASVASMAEAYAVMAFAVSGPIRLANERLAVDINRSQFRRALATVRTATREAVPEVRVQFRDLASWTFTAKLDELKRWPRRADLFARKLDHDRAEAALIGWGGLQREAQGR